MTRVAPFTQARRQAWHPARRQAGFTLVELMVAVAIVGVLSGLAYPAYSSYVVRTQRASAITCLSEMAQFMERVYASNLRYDQNNAVATALPAAQCRTDIASRYTLSFPSGQPAERTFSVQAVPQGTQATADGKCATLTLAHTGAKSVSGTGSVNECWR